MRALSRGFVGYDYIMTRSDKGKHRTPYVEVTCPCGKVFEKPKRLVDVGKGKRCSKECQYKYATRPSGLTYEIHQENAGWFEPGHEPWHKGTTGVSRGWPKGVPSGRVPTTAWQEQPNPGYAALHARVRRRKVKSGVCSRCGSVGKTQWANVSHEYLVDLGDYVELCYPCHAEHDRGRSDIKRRFE